ncbi:MAG TPA: CBS domain-containing protein [Methylomirabilota bacterium]|jgi:CBS domain-containing protein|nr:CBS domain-containing protein [Methylomirabilota bacterium]
MNIATVLASKGVKVVTVQPEQTIREALALLAEHNIGALVVVDETQKPVGIVSERDIVRALAKTEAVFQWSISRIMTKEVIIGSPQDDLAAAGHTMTERRIRHLPVMERGKLVGIVSIGDILKVQRDQYQGEVDTLQLQLLKDQA